MWAHIGRVTLGRWLLGTSDSSNWKLTNYNPYLGFLWQLSGKEPACQCRRRGFNPWVTKIPWRRKGQPIPVFLPGESDGQRSLASYSPWGRTELDTTERLHFHFTLSCIGERNGHPLQCSCLENPRDGGAWWAVVYGVAQSWTQLKWLSSSSNSSSSRQAHS